MTTSHVVLPALLVAMAAALPSQDVVHLSTGAKFEGVIVEKTDASVTLQVDGGTLTFQREQIDNIQVNNRSGQAPGERVLLTLSRFSDHESFHFLYRDGRRIGYRTLSLRRQVREGIPGYALRDRLVFMEHPGAAPDVDLKVLEFIDAGLRPIAFECGITSGPMSRVTEGVRAGAALVMKERVGDRLTETSTLMDRNVEFPRMLLRRLAGEPPPEGGYPIFRVLRPRDASFGRLGLSRHVERMSIRGSIGDILVFRRQERERCLETWFDMSGHVVREEIGSTRVVSLRSDKDEVLGFARGEEIPESLDLGLEVVSEATGFRLLRPDLAWESVPGVSRGRIVSLLRPGLRATVDVFLLEHLAGDATVEGVAVDVMSRMKRQSDGLQVEQPYMARVGDLNGLRFDAVCYRRGSRIRTMAGLVLDGRGNGFLILCAAPEQGFGAARPGFIELLTTVRILNPIEDDPDPFERAGARVRK